MSSVRDEFAKFNSTDSLSEFLHRCVSELSTNQQSSETDESLASAVKRFYIQRGLDETVPLPWQVPEHIGTALDAVFKIRHKDIVNHIVKDKLVTSGYTLVESFDWRLKLVLGSSKVATIREPLCQLDLICMGKSIINFECDLQRLDQLIAVLTQIKSDLNI